MNDTVLAVYMEPAPYITGLVRELRSTWGGKLDVVFIGKALTQDWDADASSASFLPASRVSALRVLASRLTKSNYGLLHLAGWGHPVLLGAMLLAAGRGLPVVAETDTQIPRWEPAWRRVMKALLYPALFAIPRGFLPAGTRQTTYLKKYRVPDRSIWQSRMTVDVSRITKFAASRSVADRMEIRRKLGVSDAARTLFLYMGRLEDYKGVHELLDAYIRLRTRRDDVALVIAGSGSLEPLIRAAADSIRSVHFVGHAKGDQVLEAYCAADICVLPSRRDSWGLVVNEAMASGLPVIISDAVGCADDLVRPGLTGLIARARDPKSLCDAMLKIAEEPQLRERMGAEAQQLISNWTLAQEAKIVVSAWQEALA